MDCEGSDSPLGRQVDKIHAMSLLMSSVIIFMENGPIMNQSVESLNRLINIRNLIIGDHSKLFNKPEFIWLVNKSDIKQDDEFLNEFRKYNPTNSDMI